MKHCRVTCGQVVCLCHTPAGTSVPGQHGVRISGHIFCFQPAKNTPKEAATPKTRSGWERALAVLICRQDKGLVWDPVRVWGGGEAGQEGQRLRMSPAFKGNYWRGVGWISSQSLFCALTTLVTLITHGTQNNTHTPRATIYSRWQAFPIGPQGLSSVRAGREGRHRLAAAGSQRRLRLTQPCVGDLVYMTPRSGLEG